MPGNQASERGCRQIIGPDPPDRCVRVWVAAAETLLVSDLFLPIDVADSLWSLEVEDKIIADLKKFVG